MWSPTLYLLLLTIAHECSSVAVYEFQKNSPQSDSFLMYSGNLRRVQPFTEVSFCARLRFSYLWEVSGFLQLRDNSTGQNKVMLEAAANINHIRVHVGEFRRYHFFRNNKRLESLTWHHVCLTYQNGTMTSYLDGKLQDSHNSGSLDPITPTSLKIGAYDKEQSYSGNITQINIWSHALTAKEVEGLSNCVFEREGDVAAWRGPWTLHGDVSRLDLPTTKFCRNLEKNKIIVFPDVAYKDASQICRGIGGKIYTPTTQDQYNRFVQRVKTSLGGKIQMCYPFWVGISDDNEEGGWVEADGKTSVDAFWAKNEPDGQIVQNCATIGPHGGGIEDAPCFHKKCAACLVPSDVVWSMFGTCERLPSNTQLRAFQEEPGNLFFRGYTNYEIRKSGENWHWIDWRRNKTVAQHKSIGVSPPYGRKKWVLEEDYCTNKSGDEIDLLLTHCKRGSFSCDDATCIDIQQRCDLKLDCLDKSDEKDCKQIRIPAFYRKDIPPPATADSPLPVTMHVTIDKVDVDTRTMLMFVNFNLNMTWRDPRLQFINLNNDFTFNRMKQEYVNNIWTPKVDFTNTEGNHITQLDDQATMMVTRLGESILGDYSLPEEVELFEGKHSSIHLDRKYSITFQCQFSLKRFPFDEQECSMVLTMLSASHRLVVFDAENSNITFVGNGELVEYTVTKMMPTFSKQGDFSTMHVRVFLDRLWGHILLNVYVPSMLLLFISYLTLYFKTSLFPVRILASLTILLVMCTLFSQVSSMLPKSSYVKLVDVWLLCCICVVLLIIIFHTIIDRLQEEDNSATIKNSLKKMLGKDIIVDMLKPIFPSAVDGSSFSQNPQDNTSTGVGSTEQIEQSNTNRDRLPSLSNTDSWPPFQWLVFTARLVVATTLAIFNIAYWTVAIYRPHLTE